MRINERDFPCLTGFGNSVIQIQKDIVSKLTTKQWTRINNLLINIAPTEIKQKLLNCIHWLSEATKYDSNNSKFMKICIALEALLGGESKKDDRLTIRGITASLAERSAFIYGTDLNTRLNIDEQIRQSYKKRSAIVHGMKEQISDEAVKNFGQLVRSLALKMLELIELSNGTLKDIDDLEDWVRQQRYT